MFAFCKQTNGTENTNYMNHIHSHVAIFFFFFLLFLFLCCLVSGIFCSFFIIYLKCGENEQSRLERIEIKRHFVLPRIVKCVSIPLITIIESSYRRLIAYQWFSATKNVIFIAEQGLWFWLFDSVRSTPDWQMFYLSSKKKVFFRCFSIESSQFPGHIIDQIKLEVNK